MGCKPEMAVFRKFRTLNVLRLLEMQSELADREQEYQDLHLLDAGVDCSITKSYAKDWDALNDSQGKSGTLQRDAWRRIKDRLEPYSKQHISAATIVLKVPLTIEQTMRCCNKSRYVSMEDQVSMT